MKTVLHCALMLAVVLIGVPGYTAERLALYDDFNATQINPDKWFGSEYSPAFPSASTEAIRQLQDARLYLRYRSYGPTDADGGRLRSELALLFRTPAAVTAIQAAVQVTDVGATGCPGNLERTVASANLGGRFFGTVPSTPGGDVTDTVALIGMFRGSESTAPPDELRARSLVFHCTNRPCTAGSELHRQDLGPVKRGEFVRLRVQWDRDHHQFGYSRDTCNFRT
jgi:hypothetical protein